MSDSLPTEIEPDGNVYAPHHWWQGIVTMVAGFLLWQDTLFPGAGFALSVLGVLWAADDLISHGFGVWTPIDALFKWFMRNAGWFQRIYYALERLNPGQEAPQD